MNKLTLTFWAMAALASAAYAGPEYSGKEMKQVAPPPCPQWYADNEFNVSLWGTYLFTGNDWANDRYVEADHAWGGGIDLKYFFHRYFGVGIEGWVVDARRETFDFEVAPPVFIDRTGRESRAVGSVLGTFTLRYPIPCTRFAPYIWAGGGAIFGGGERDVLHTQGPPDAFAVHAQTDHFGSETKLLGQFGAGLEFRIARHFGWTND